MRKPKLSAEEKEKQRLRAERDSLTDRRHALMSKYNMTLEQYARKLLKQSGRCAICRKKPVAGQRNFPVDHDHKTKRIRGILCLHCNVMIGMADDSVDRLLDAIDYLRNYGIYQ